MGENEILSDNDVYKFSCPIGQSLIHPCGDSRNLLTRILLAEKLPANFYHETWLFRMSSVWMIRLSAELIEPMPRIQVLASD